jgi:hypothetical protein
MADGEGTGEGTGTGAGTGQQGGEFRAQFPADLKDHEAFKPYKTIGDLGKAHLDLIGKVKDLDGKTAKITELEGKLSSAIFKPGEKATDEEKTAYRKSLGVPEKPEQYEFEKAEGIEHDPNMISWAQKVFHKYNVSKESAVGIGREWDAFLKGVDEEEDKLIQGEITENQKKFREMKVNGIPVFKTDDEFKAALELNKRYWKKVTGEDMPAFVDGFSFTKFIHEHAKKYGEDMSLQGGQARGTGEEKPGMIYDKTPQHQKK